MKRGALVVLFLSAMLCFPSISPCIASAGEARFGTGVTSDWKLIDESTEFDTNLITCGFFAEKPFGVLTVAVSIYYQATTANEVLLTRANLEVNPEWDLMLLPDLPLPGVGKYTFTLSTTGGETLASGAVTITQKKVEEEMPEQPKVDGTTLEGLFNKFKPAS